MSDIHALSGAYAVDALDDLERARFERHLADCDTCRAEVDGLRETAALLSTRVVIPPPAALRERVLADIHHVRPLPPIVPVQVPRRRWTPFLVAAVLAVLAVGLGLARPWESAPQQPVASPVEQVLADPAADVVTHKFSDGSQATITRSAAHGRAVIATTGMAPAPDGKVYELWLQDAQGAMHPAGLMDGKDDATLLLEGDASEATGVGITVEPAGGSEEPTSDPLVVFDLRSV